MRRDAGERSDKEIRISDVEDRYYPMFLEIPAISFYTSLAGIPRTRRLDVV